MGQARRGVCRDVNGKLQSTRVEEQLLRYSNGIRLADDLTLVEVRF